MHTHIQMCMCIYKSKSAIKAQSSVLVPSILVCSVASGLWLTPTLLILAQKALPSSVIMHELPGQALC